MQPHIAALALLVSISLAAPAAAQAQQSRVLVFSRTEGYRHSSIANGIAAITKLGQENGFAVDATEDAGAFTEKNLRRYSAVVFLNTTGDVLDAAQQDDFERYIQAGGGYVGIHSATDTEYDWPWYGRLAGAYFTSHPNNPNVRKGSYRTLDSTHASTQGFPARFEREDEFYNFKSIDPTIRVLVEIDETSYEGGTNGAHHPMSWYHDFAGGRAWYTNMGHTEATYTEPLFLRHLLGGLRYAMGTGTINFQRARPEENRFTRVVLAEKLNEPIELAVLPDERVLFIERRGAVNLYKPFPLSGTERGSGGEVHRIATIPVSTKYADSSQAEDGLLGLALDPNFRTNGWVYMFFSPAGPDAKNVLARFTLRGDSLDLGSQKVILEVPVQRRACCHTGGSITFDRAGNLYLSTGDNSNPFATGYAPIDERPGREPWDAQKSSANTNDLRGKIIRIHPEPDGSYTIPSGNLFPPGTAKTRPEIYTMGHRNPYRISVDQRTGFLYWGDVGPDADIDSAGRGTRGYDEIGQARSAGNYGWPYFVGNNQAYYKTTVIDSTRTEAGPKFNPAYVVNRSPNNTGLTTLPPARVPFIWYPYGQSPDFPIVGTGGRTAEAGPVFYRSDFANAARPFPQYYDGKLFIYEFMRHWIMAVTMDARGDLVSIERFMPSVNFAAPIEMEFGPNGDLYVLEYGTLWFQGNDDARLLRIEYNAGNRAPVVAAKVDTPKGALPLRVAFSSEGTLDFDEDSLRYQWTISRGATVLRRLSQPNPSFTFTSAGTYSATLTVTDVHGAATRATPIEIIAGNQPPVVEVAVTGGNTSFFFPEVAVPYAVRVSDREDGTLESGRIAAARVLVSAQYAKDGPPATVGAPSGNRVVEGQRLVEAGDCLACHQVDRQSIGPKFRDVAAKYLSDSSAMGRLANKIRAGGSGVWGPVAMPAHSALSEEQAAAMVAYIMSLGDTSTRGPALPPSGSYAPPAGSGDAPQGVVVLRAEYTDRGANGMPPITADKTLVLRAPTVVVANGERSDGVSQQSAEGIPVPITVVSRPGASVSLEQIDLTGVGAVTFVAFAPSQYGAKGGTIEVRADSVTGVLLGQSEPIAPSADQMPATRRVALVPAAGVHDLYFVFTHPGASGDGFMFGVLTARFEPASR
jgi:cytochrome c